MSYKSLERCPGFMVKVVQIVIGCPGNRIKHLGEDLRDLFNEKEIFKIVENHKRMSYVKANS